MEVIEKKKPLILIVDDVAKNLQVLGNILSKKGYKIAIATNGEQALLRIRQNLPDLILLDVMMPDMDGFEVCKKLKEVPETSEIPVIFLTGKTETGDIVKGFELGAVDYVVKPFNSTELLARVNTHLSLKEAREGEKKLRENLQEKFEEIERKNIELKELNELKNQFLGIAAHDLRSPLTVINTYIFAISNDNLMDEQVTYLGKVKDITNYMLNLINNLLDLSAIETGHLTLDMKQHNYIKFLKDSIELNKAIASKKNISLDLKYVEEIPFITFDRDKLTQVINNLISNAIKFSHKNTAITVEVKKENEFITTSVIDQGQGIPSEELHKLFREFQKTSVKSTGKEKSTGLGLAITKKIIEAHKGRVGVESKVGEGSEFYFTLPSGAVENYN